MFCMDAQFIWLIPVRLTPVQLINWLPILVLTIINCPGDQWLVEQWDGRLIIAQSILYMHTHTHAHAHIQTHTYTCTCTHTNTHTTHTHTQHTHNRTKPLWGRKGFVWIYGQIRFMQKIKKIGKKRRKILSKVLTYVQSQY